MSTQDAADKPVITPDMAALIIAAFKNFHAGNEALHVGLLGMASILALLPGTAQIDSERLAVVLEAFTANNPNAETLKPRIAAYVSMVVSIARDLPGVMSDAAMDQAIGSAGKKKN
jgi:hypothetical protein